MIKGYYSPATEDLVLQLMSNEATGVYELDSNIKDWQVAHVIDALRRHGYDVSVEVEITGNIEEAFSSLKRPEEYVAHMRPVRRVKT